jgi:hypothetical protein
METDLTGLIAFLQLTKVQPLIRNLRIYRMSGACTLGIAGLKSWLSHPIYSA